MTTYTQEHSSARNPYLEKIALLYENGEYVAEKVWPVVSTENDLVEVAKFTLENMHRAYNTRAPRTGKISKRTIKFGTVQARLEPHSQSVFIPNDFGKSFRQQEGVKNLPVETAMNDLKLNQEIRVAAKVFDPNNYGANFKLIGTGDADFVQWDDPSATPHRDIITAKSRVFGSSKQLYAVFGKEAWDSFSTHPEVLKAIQSVAGGLQLTPEVAAKYLGLQEIFIGEARALSMPMDDETNTTFEYVWGDSVVVFTKPSKPRPNGYETSFGYIYRKGNLAGQSDFSDNSVRVYQWEDHSEDADGGVWTKASVTQAEFICADFGACILSDVLS